MSTARHVSRWAAALLLLPLPSYLLLSMARDPGPAWRAEYRAKTQAPGAGNVVGERALSQYWDRQNPRVPGGLDARQAAARFDACLSLEAARDIPFMLVANGNARLRIDGKEQLSVEAGKVRGASGAVLRLAPGVHHLEVDFTARSWPSIALNASFDGRAPVALGSGELARGVELSHPLPGQPPCAPPS